MAEIPACFKIGDIWTNSIGMRFAYIPAGEFMMGSSPNEEGRGDGEAQHRVRFSKPFLMGVYPVTQAQWRAMMGMTAAQLRDMGDPEWYLPGEGDDHPIYYVTWDEAVAFCRKLSKRDDRRYRLPTEAEWEYACRASSTGAYAGTGRLDDMGWYAGNSGDQRMLCYGPGRSGGAGV